METDLDFIRNLLIEIEDKCHGVVVLLEVDRREADRIAHHVELLEGAGFIKGPPGGCVDHNEEPPAIRIIRLTWDGHEFLDVARDDANWQIVKDTVKRGCRSMGSMQKALEGLLMDKTQKVIIEWEPHHDRALRLQGRAYRTP